MELDDFIEAYEAARARGEQVDLETYLPEPSDALYGSALRELVRIDLEYHWDSGRPRPLESYRSSFPDLFRDPESLSAITFEEFRLRCLAGEDPSPAEYERRFGVDTTTWPRPQPVGAAGDPAAPARPQVDSEEVDPLLDSALMAETALSYQEWWGGQDGQGGAVGHPFRDGFGVSHDHAAVFADLHRSDPVIAERLARAVTTMPRVGGELIGFRLLAELGRGAFGRVYLAQQGELADRLVVLKTVPDLFGESKTLAQLQHTHIVPIYSVHRAGAFQTVCMPYFGTTTLADVLKDLRSRPTLPDSGKYLLDRIEARKRERTGASERPHAGPAGSLPPDQCAPLANLSYVDAVLWLAARLSDALAHAHGRGILHRDLKPANILLTDEGQPMLLDFNLSEDTKLHRRASVARIGGTLPYMAPEQLRAVQSGLAEGDERSDLYSLGIILFEMLTGRYPFALSRGPREQMIGRLDAARRRMPGVRCRNPAVSPAVESIVRYCLEPEPSRRYQTARELHEDLQRQLDHRPLRYASEPSPWERLRKWTRRHPRLSSSTGVGVLAALLILAVAGALLLRVRHLGHLRAAQAADQARLEAVAALQRLHHDLKAIEGLLGSRISELEREQQDEGMALARGLLDQYQVLGSADWQETPMVAALAPDQKQQLREEMGELLVLLAGASARQAQLDLALRLSALAEGCYSAGAVPRALWRQRADLAGSAGHADEARRLLERAEQTPAGTLRDRYLLLLTEYQQEGRLPDALPLLQEAIGRERDNFSVRLILGNCYAQLRRRTEAIECYDMASALWPEWHWAHLCRGMACLELGDYQRARAAFDEVIRLRPDLPQPYYNRALARFHLRDHAGARADLTHLLEGPRPPPRAYLLRARVRDREGDREGARQDREAGIRAEPRDERDWTARGLAQLPRDPRAALADYERALELNPRYPAALQNKAHVLGEVLGRTEEAAEALDRLVTLYPDDVPARAARGVLRARLGRREAAHADAQESLRRDSKPSTVYQVAGIYAQTSRQVPDDRKEALRLLGSALSQGVGLRLIPEDRDLDPIRDRPEFRQLVEAARARGGQGSPRPAKPQADGGRRPEAASDRTPVAPG
jgi:serine/threonine protein kinase/Tfp pilus assembly protein PilF